MADKKYELEFSLSDGTSKKVEFTAPQGPEGTAGKTAYEFAKDGGYTGTESEFAAKLAADAVSVTYDESTKTLNISSVSGGVTAEQVSELAGEYDVEKIVLDGVELKLPSGQLMPEFANSIDECTDTSKVYVLPGGGIYEYTTSESKEVFTDVLSEVGYQNGKRVNSSGAIVAYNSDTYVTGYIPCKTGDIIRIKNITIPDTYTSGSYKNTVSAYTADKVFIKSLCLATDVEGLGKTIDAVEEDGNIVQFTVKGAVFGSEVAYIVISTGEITDESEVYVNSTIVTSDEWASTGYAFVTPELEARLKSIEAGVSSDIPEYWLDELREKSEEIRLAVEDAGRNKSAFLWYADSHWDNGNAKMSPILLGYLCQNTPLNKVNFGGDIVGDPASFTHDNIKYVYEWRKMIADLPNHHSVYGNHDVSHRTTDVEKMTYALLLADEEISDMVVGGDSYYCIDYPSEKTRYLYLSYLTNDHTEMMEQGKFIVDAISSVTDGWHIVVIAHRWLQYTSSSAPTVGSVPAYETEILSIFDAYNARTTRDSSNYFYEQDFTDCKGKVEFCIGGHIHVDYDFKSDGGIPVIITASDTNQVRGDNETACGTIGTITESAVFGIIADYDNNKITVVGVGRGTSREILLNTT